jgi:peptidyl-prolyl cis-trans isomerase SurA
MKLFDLRFPWPAVALGLMFAGGLAAQQPTAPPLSIDIPGEPDELVDRVVAVAGDSLILLSQLSNEMLVLAAQGVEFPSDTQGMRDAARDVLESMVNLQLLLQEAQRDTTLALDDAEIDGRIQAQIGAVQQQLGGPAQLQAAIEADGMTMTEYRETLRTRIQQNLMRDLYLRRQFLDLPPVAITEEEMRDLYEAQRASLQERPEILALEQVVIPATPPDSMWDNARAELDSLVARIAAGEDFETVAQEASDDLGSGANGGDLGWFRRGAMVPEFDAVAFALPDAVVSEPFRSSFGWHVIRVDRRRPGEVKARHILVRPESGPDDLGDTLERAREIGDRLLAGEDAQDLADEYGHQDGIPVRLPRVSRDGIAEQLPPGYGAALADVTEGEVIPPFELDFNGPFVAVVRVTEIREAGEFTFEDVEDQIRERLQEQKNLERIWQSLRDRAFVDIRF